MPEMGKVLQKTDPAQLEYLGFFIQALKVVFMWPKWRPGRLFSIIYYISVFTVTMFLGIILMMLVLKIIATFEVSTRSRY